MNGRGGQGKCFSVKEMENGRGISTEWTNKKDGKAIWERGGKKTKILSRFRGVTIDGVWID
jgi:hypothetical protein